jgi:hypothetical protein
MKQIFLTWLLKELQSNPSARLFQQVNSGYLKFYLGIGQIPLVCVGRSGGEIEFNKN